MYMNAVIIRPTYCVKLAGNAPDVTLFDNEQEENTRKQSILNQLIKMLALSTSILLLKQNQLYQLNYIHDFLTV